MDKHALDPACLLGDRLQTLSRAELTALAEALCRILAERGTYHGGIRPDNISRAADGTVGLGAPARTDTKDWTTEELEFMAPEVFWSGTLDASADVYSLGLLLYVGVSGGRLPFYPDDRAPLPEDQTDALRRRMNGEALPPARKAGRGLQEIIARATQCKPDDRYATPAELCAALEQYDAEQRRSVPTAQEMFNKPEQELSEVERMMLDILAEEAAAPVPEAEPEIAAEPEAEAAPEKPEAQACLRAAGYPYLVAAVLSARGIETPEQAAAFLEREDKLTISPFLMRDMDKAAARVQRAIAGGERIAVFGDYDVDGITATCILVDYLKSRGADVVHYIPRRIEDGYGLSRDAIKGLFDQGVRLLVTVDCGITGVEEVDYANSLGLDVVITDHHECREVLPRAVAVVDPHRADCGYPFKHLAGCGVALKLVLALGGPDREEPLFARYCTLAAIGTVADVMQMSGENRTIVSRGLATLEHSDFIGLHALLQEAGLSGKEISSVQIGFVLAPRINAAGRLGT